MNPDIPEPILLFKGRKVLLYHQVQTSSEPATIIKVLKKAHPAPEEVARFYNEYDVAQISDKEGNCLNDIKGVRRIYKRGTYEQQPAMYLEYIEGKTLTQLIKENKKYKVGDFLKIAIELTHILGRIHHHYIIHRDINPNNVLITISGGIRIIDFGIASKISAKTNYLSSNVAEGTLTHISPEQTGRINQAVDYRSDLYSLGVTFYEMLTGKLPFPNKDKMELVHAHIAIPPIAPALFDVPPVLSQIILKLLSKNVEDRYQSAYGLRKDLEEIATYFKQRTKVPEQFGMGKKDRSGILEIPEKLYGREQELDLFHQAYDRVTKGACELVLVSGMPGVGKSKLIYEIYPKITQQSGFFIEGKYEQFQRQIPYAAITQAFNDLYRHIVALPEAMMLKWKKIILEAVGNNGRLLTDVMPDLKLIIGEQPPVASIGGQEAQNRFQWVVQRFVKAISTKENPLVLFLDDLQWADISSLQFLQTMLSQNDNQYLLVIGAYRSNEVGESHPFNIILYRLKQASETAIQEITLQNLSLLHIRDLLKEALYFDDYDGLNQLAELVYAKTRGNAFFVLQFIKSLYEEMLLTFSFKQQRWQWDVTKIQECNITDNVVSLMAEKLAGLPPDTLQILKIAACFGNTFSLEQVNLILDNTSESLFACLWSAVTAGFILPPDKQSQTSEFKFTHDRIEQATYGLWDKKQREKLHLQIARIFLVEYNNQQKQAYLVANHFSKAMRLLKTKEEKLAVIQVNLKAAEKAQQTNAYSSALAYYKAGLSLIDDWVWKHDQFAFRFCYGYANCAYLTGEFETAHTLFNGLLVREVNVLDKVRVYHALSDLCSAKSEQKEAQMYLFKALDLLNILYPATREDWKLFFDREFEETNFIYEQTSEDKILNAPVINSKKEELLLATLTQLANISYILKELLLASWAAVKAANITLQEGNSIHASISFLYYGNVCIIQAKDNVKGYKIGKIAVKLSEKMNDSFGQKAAINYTFGAASLHWATHQKNSLEYHRKAIEYGLEGGDNFHAAAAMFSLLQGTFLIGYHLDEVETEHEKLLPVLSRINPFVLRLNVMPVTYQPIKQLLGKTPATDSFNDEEFNEIRFLAECKTNGVAFFYTAKARNLYIFDHFEQGAELALHYDDLLAELPPFINVAEGVFYIALHLLATYRETTEEQQVKSLALIDDALEKLENWTKDASMNFRSRVLLVRAEKRNLVEQRYFEAVEFYEQAIWEAHRTGYLYIEAIAQERLAVFWMQHKKENYAKLHLQQAYKLFKGWGARAKVSMMDEKYPYFLSAQKEAKRSPGTSLPSSTYGNSSGGGSGLDMNTILKSSTTLIGEIHLEPLLEKMIQIVAESAGAQKIFIIENKQEQLVLRMKGEMIGNQMAVVTVGMPLEQSQELPVSLINYVFRRKTHVVIPDAMQAKILRKDAYVRRVQPKSILCYPIVRQDKMSLVFYMENNLAIGTFTDERLEVLNILSSQIATSIENAQLYENLEDEVKARTKELRKTNESLNNANEAIKEQQTALQTQHYQLEQAYQNVQLLTAIGQEITSSLDLDKILNTIYTHVNKLMDANTFGIGIYNKEAQEIDFRLALEKGQRYAPYTRSMANKNQLAVWCIEKGEPVRIGDIPNEYHLFIEVFEVNAHLQDGSKAEMPYSAMYLPLLVQRRVLGVISVQSFEKNAYTDYHFNLLKNLSIYVAIAIDNAQVYTQIDTKNKEISAQADVLTDLNGQLERHNKDVAASIRNAQRIQQAVLPFADRMSAFFPEHFVFFRPRDVVSGDFYWFETVGDKIFVVAADCTGHGIPGAFMTMLGTQALMNVVMQKRIYSPEQILNALNEMLPNILKTKTTLVRDGMDVVVCVIDKQEKTLKYAGAKNPLILIQNNNFEIIKGDKYSINGHKKDGDIARYTLHTFKLDITTTFYMFSDGIQDQFGIDKERGNKRRKFSSRRLNNLLLENYQKPIFEQKQILEQTLDDWQDGAKQIDDMLLIGVRITPEVLG